MGKSKKQKLAAAIEAAKGNQVKAQDAFDAIVEAGVEKEAAQEVLDAANAAVETAENNLANHLATVADGETLVKVRALLPLAGKFLLPYDPGTEFEISKNQAEEIVDAKYGEYVTE